MLSKNLRQYINEVDRRDSKSKTRRLLYGLFIDIAHALPSMRKSKGLSQRELAKILKTSHPTITRWETPGYTGYTLSKLIEVAEALDHSVELRFVPKDITINKIEVVDWIDRVSLTAWKNNVSLTSQIHREIDTRSDSFNVRANAVTKVRSI